MATYPEGDEEPCSGFQACKNLRGRRKKKKHGLEDRDDGSINGEEREGVTVGLWEKGEEGEWLHCHGRFGGEQEGGGEKQKGWVLQGSSERRRGERKNGGQC